MMRFERLQIDDLSLPWSVSTDISGFLGPTPWLCREAGLRPNEA